MSKGNFLTNNVSGRLGAMVFMRRNGEQVQRSWVKPKDAGTYAQGKQRSALSNIVRLYQSSPSFFKLAFENKASNQSDYNALVARNLAANPKVYLPKEVADAGGAVVAPYLISDGSLQQILTEGEGITTRTNISLGADFEITASTTVAQFTQAILDNNTFIQEGDQLSYLSIEQYTSEGYPRLRTRKYEVILSTMDNNLLYASMPMQAVAVSGGFLAHGDFVYSGAFAWILSRVVAGKIKVSRQRLIVTDVSLYSSYTGNDAATKAASSYNDKNVVFLDPNTVGEGVASSPSSLPSVALVQLQGVSLSSNQGTISLATANTIAAEALKITGSNMTGVTEVSLTVTNESDDAQVTVTVPVTVEGDTLIENTAAITVTGVTVVSAMSVSIDSSRVFSWTAADAGDLPLG